MLINYDANQVAEQYQQAKKQPWRSRIETYSLMKLLGDLRGKRVVDVACGDGYFTRRLRQAGATEVVGFDNSERMIELARAQEAAAPLGIQYQLEDARTIVPQRDFDLAVSAWLLVYARDRQELASMCRGLACRVRPGGRFVTLTTNPGVYSFEPRPDYRKYGFEIALADHAYEGAPIQWTIDLGDSSMEIENYYLPISAYESAFLEAGFRDFAVRPLELEPNPQGTDDRAYWADFLKNPIAILIECVKA